MKGEEARLNTPGTAQGNWQWRVVPDLLSHELAQSIRGLTQTYGRMPKKEIKKETEKETKKETEKDS